MSNCEFDIKDVRTNSSDFGKSICKISVPTGRTRGLTAGEVEMAKHLFKDSIDYSRVKVHNYEYLWFGFQPDDTAMTPDGEMYFNADYFREDFSAADDLNRRWFMHEMTHVWQYQLGYPVKLRGAIRIGLPYEYTPTRNNRLSDFNMEAQGEVLADYFSHTVLKATDVIRVVENRTPEVLSILDEVLKDFLADPSNRANLPK